MSNMLSELISRGLNKENQKSLISYVGRSEEKFDMLILAFDKADRNQSQLIAWAVGELILQNHKFIDPHHKTLLILMSNPELHIGVRRNIVRAYQFAPIPNEIEGELYDKCLKNINNPTEAIAVRAFSMTVCYRIVERYPELANELKVSIESTLENASSGLRNRAEKILRKLQKY